MFFLGIGILLLALKLANIPPVVGWNWWIVLSPFALTVIWWTWADFSGYTKRKEMKKMDAVRDSRLRRNREALKNSTKHRQ